MMFTMGPTHNSLIWIRRWAVVALLLALVTDQITKFLVLHADFGPLDTIEVAPFFRLVKWWNHGVSFGVGNSGHTSDIQRAVLTVGTLAIVAGLCYWLRQTVRLLPAVAIGMIIGGAIGNLADRFHYGAVADFLYFHYRQYGWPAFNVGDSCIVAGVGLIMLDGLLARRDKSVSFGDVKHEG